MNTTAATVGSSRTKSKECAATVEEVIDDRDCRTKTLPNNIEVVMMTESEFLSLSEGGEMKERKHNKKTFRNIKKEPKKVPQNKRRSIGFDITGECEPSSSKIKVEDLVKDEKESTETPKRRKELWDRPVPPPDLRWTRDPRLPKELNEMNAAIWDYNWAHFAPRKEEY